MTLPSPTQREDERCRLLSLINFETTLVGLIPSEVWSHIFFILTLPPVVTFDDMVGHRSIQRLCNIAIERNKRTGDRDLRNISQVCHAWRVIAITTPILWSHINFAHPRPWLDLKRTRSKAIPLCISGGWGSFSIGESYLEQFSMLGRVEITVPAGSRARLVLLRSTRKALEHLPIQNISNLTITVGTSKPYPAPLPTIPIRSISTFRDSGGKAYDNGSYSLRTLILHGCMLSDLTHPFFSSITRLYVGQKPHPSSRQNCWISSDHYSGSVSSSEQWLATLKHMPHLTHLHLQGMVMPSSSTHDAQITLPNLIDLSLIDAYMGGGICEILYGINATQPGSLYLSVSLILNHHLEELLVKGLRQWFNRWPQPLPDPGTVGILSGTPRFLIHNSPNKSGLRFHISHQAIPHWYSPFRTYAIQFIMPVINGLTHLKLMKGKCNSPVPLLYTISADASPFWNVQRLTLLESPRRWRRKDYLKKFPKSTSRWLPYCTLKRIVPSGPNPDFPQIPYFPALQEIQYLPESPALLVKSSHTPEIVLFIQGFLGVDSCDTEYKDRDVILARKSEIPF